MACWDIVGKAVKPTDLQLARRPIPRQATRLRLHAQGPALTKTRHVPARSPSSYSSRVTPACKLDPFRPLYPLPRDISLAEITHAERIFESIRNAVGNQLEVGIGTHGQPHHLQRHPRPPKPWRNTNPSGLKSRCRRRTLTRWRASPPTTSNPHRQRRATRHEVRVCRVDRKNRPLRSSSSTLGQCGGILEIKEDRQHRRGPLRDDRPAHGLRAHRRCGCPSNSIPVHRTS